MSRRSRALLTGLALTAGGIGVVATAALSTMALADGASESQVDDSEDANEGPDIPITGPDLERASAAALEFTGEGRVTATEIGDEESYYEVEVRLDDGREVDVQLDEAFNVVGTD